MSQSGPLRGLEVSQAGPLKGLEVSPLFVGVTVWPAERLGGEGFGGVTRWSDE